MRLTIGFSLLFVVFCSFVQGSMSGSLSSSLRRQCRVLQFTLLFDPGCPGVSVQALLVATI